MSCIMQAACHVHLKPVVLCAYAVTGLLPDAELPGLGQGSHIGAAGGLHAWQLEGTWGAC